MADDGRKVPGNELSENGFTIPIARQIDKTLKPKTFKLSDEDRRQHLSYSRKAASAQIAKIPAPLARWIAHAWRPDEPRKEACMERPPLAIDLFCGLGGWTEGLLAEGFQVIGFDIERHTYGEARYPAQLVLQDVTTIHGSQFKDAALIVASPPCQAYSYRAMPWKRAKALPPPDNTLFETCFRIQREAIEAAGHHIPLVVENVCGAQKWVGKARWHYGSFYLWGDVPALMPTTFKAQKVGGFRFDGNGGSFQTASVKVAGLNWSNYGKDGYKAEAFNTTAEQRLKATKNDGGSWFNVAHNTTSGHGQNPDGRKNGGDWFGSAADCSLQRRASSKGNARKAASAHIARIPFPLAQHIARAWKP